MRLTFWIAWTLDGLLSTVIFLFFLVGLADGSVSSFNIGIWIAILAALTAVLVGSQWLKAVGHPLIGTMLLLVLAVPGVIYLLFLLVVITSGSQWN